MRMTYIDHMGTDLSVVNAARVSFDKESCWVANPFEQELHEKDEKLISYLAAHKHWTPFAHTALTIRVRAPLFVRTQCFKHKVGLVENEVSRRYVDDEPDFYIPTEWRGRPKNKKQGSSGSPNADNEAITRSLRQHYVDCKEYYLELLSIGVAPEQARMVLPQSMLTEWVWTGNLVSFANFYDKRSSPDAQWEIQKLASMLPLIISPLFPCSWEALVK